MKKFILSIAAVVLIGCASTGTWQTTAGKFLTSTALSVDTAMKGAAQLEVQGIISTNDWAAIKVYYAQYQGAMFIATNAYTLAVRASDPTLWGPASNNLFVAKTTLTTKTTTLSFSPK